MATTNLTIRIDEDLKLQFEELVNGLGLTLTTAITAYAKQAVREQQIPFKLSMNVPNAETVKALEEVEGIIGGRIPAKRYSSVDELFEELDK